MKVQELSRRSSAILLALLFLAINALPLFINRTVSAYTLLGEREIQMSTSQPSATGVSYLVDFETATTDNIGGIVVAFCAGSPIIGDTTCAVPAGFSLTGAAAADTGQVGAVNLSTFTAAFTNVVSAGGANPNTLTFSNATAITGNTAGQQVQFQITNVTNPTAVGSFYARIMVYSTQALANGYTLNDINTPEQAGGIALSTADQITIQAKVQERIEFCVYTSAINYANCTVDATDPVILGDANGVLSSLNASVSKDAKYNITTNASAGATIRMKGTTLTTGGFSIDAVGGTAAASSLNTEQFGMCTYRDTGGGVAGLAAVAPYNNVNCSTTINGQGAGNTNAGTAQFAFDTTATALTYGQSIATKSAGDWSTGILVFLGNIDNITEPGIYTTTLDFIATGRY